MPEAHTRFSTKMTWAKFGMFEMVILVTPEPAVTISKIFSRDASANKMPYPGD
jgi:hypothetical protein